MKNRFVSLLILFFTVFFLFNACQSAGEIEQARYFVNGKNIYEKHCQNCHGAKGEGLSALYPSLQSSSYVSEFRSNLACDIRFGKNDMPANPQLTAVEITYLINYIGNYFGNSTGFYSQEQGQLDLANCP